MAEGGLMQDEALEQVRWLVLLRLGGNAETKTRKLHGRFGSKSS